MITLQKVLFIDYVLSWIENMTIISNGLHRIVRRTFFLLFFFFFFFWGAPKMTLIFPLKFLTPPYRLNFSLVPTFLEPKKIDPPNLPTHPHQSIYEQSYI